MTGPNDIKPLERQMRTVIERIADGVVVCGPSGVIRYLNAGAEELFGRPADELLGEPFPLTVDDSGAGEVRFETPRGQLRWIELRASELEWEGEASKLISMHDCTDRKLGEEVRTRLERAERLAAIGQLAGGVGHEINNPLTYVGANLEVLGEELDHIRGAMARLRGCEIRDADGGELDIDQLVPPESLDEIAELLESTDLGLGKIASTVARLNQFSKVLDAEQLDLGEVVVAACRRHRAELARRARLELAIRPLPRITGDRERLTQALASLVINAAEAIEPGDPASNLVRVATRVDGSEIVVSISDTGCGIAVSQLGRIFEPFYSTRARKAGSGLGLTVAAETVRQHGGRVEVESGLGAGSRFDVRLPISSDTAKEAPAAARSQSDAPLAPDPEPQEPQEPPGALRVLVVDDEPMLLKALDRMLGLHHHVVTAPGGQEGLDAIREAGARFDAILCDLMMPEVDGADFYREVLRWWPELADRIIFTTGGAYTLEAEAFLDSVGNLQLKKPTRLDRLLAVIDEVARRG